uniref:Uncharacterized protein n=1 Tax=Medicago truncatula TaxID=3880 RepID=A2Q1C2_MEDTR|nr:hypothetical protein MtrDRAFT_AC148762g33v2 [Medicago truncatula]ABN08927.1 hypothetical protein MtrDRAFT_AC166313g6v2 [Medicago truncatula]
MCTMYTSLHPWFRRVEFWRFIRAMHASWLMVFGHPMQPKTLGENHIGLRATTQLSFGKSLHTKIYKTLGL